MPHWMISRAYRVSRSWCQDQRKGCGSKIRISWPCSTNFNSSSIQTFLSSNPYNPLLARIPMNLLLIRTSRYWSSKKKAIPTSNNNNQSKFRRLFYCSDLLFSNLNGILCVIHIVCFKSSIFNLTGQLIMWRR